MANASKNIIQSIADLSIATDPTRFVGSSETHQCEITALPFNTWGDGVDESGQPKYAPYISCSLLYLEKDGNGNACMWGKAVQDMELWEVTDEDGLIYPGDEEKGYGPLWEWFLMSRECNIGNWDFTLEGRSQSYITIQGTIDWLSYLGEEQLRSGTITAIVTSDGGNIYEFPVTSDEASAQWEFSISGLPKYKSLTDEEEFEYTLSFDLPDDYDVKIERVSTSTNEDQYQVTVTTNSINYTLSIDHEFKFTSDGEAQPFRWMSKAAIYLFIVNKNGSDVSTFPIDPTFYGSPDITKSFELTGKEGTQTYTYSFTGKTNDRAAEEITITKDSTDDKSYSKFSVTIEDGIYEYTVPTKIILTSDGKKTPSELGLGIRFNGKSEYTIALVEQSGELVDINDYVFPDEAFTELTIDVQVLKYSYRKGNLAYEIKSNQEFSIELECDEDACTVSPEEGYEGLQYDNVGSEYKFTITSK